MGHFKGQSESSRLSNSENNLTPGIERRVKLKKFATRLLFGQQKPEILAAFWFVGINMVDPIEVDVQPSPEPE